MLCHHTFPMHVGRGDFSSLEREKREIIYCSCMGRHPQNPAVLNKTAALPVGSAYVPCHGLQASSACVNIAPEQRAPRGTGFLSCGEAVDPSRALHQTSLGSCMVQVPLPHADQKSQPYSNPSEERQWLPCVSEEPCCAHQGPSHTLY